MKYYNSLTEAVKANGPLLFAKGDIRKTEPLLMDEEKIVAALSCTFDNKKSGLLVVTNYRVFANAATLGDSYFQEIPLEDIRNIESKQFSSFGVLDTMQICGAFSVIKVRNLATQNIKMIKKAISEAQDEKRSPKNVVTKLDSNSTINMQALKDLKELFDSGIITQEEFDTKKKQILNL